MSSTCVLAVSKTLKIEEEFVYFVNFFDLKMTVGIDRFWGKSQMEKCCKSRG